MFSRRKFHRASNSGLGCECAGSRANATLWGVSFWVGRIARALKVAFWLCPVLLAACASVTEYPKNPEPTGTLSTLQTKYFGPTADDAYNNLKPTDSNYSQERKALRDEIVNNRVRAYDIEFSKFQRALSSDANGLSLGGDLSALVLSGLGSATGSAATKAALAAASGGVIGAQGVINKDLYFKQTVPALIAQMEANREKVKLAIFNHLSDSDADYPLSRAESDLEGLNDAGSLPNAVSNITQQSSEQKNAADALMQSVHTLTFSSTSSSTKLNAWLFPNGVLDSGHATMPQAWLTSQPEPVLQAIPMASFVSGDTSQGDLEPFRQRALNDPRLNIPK